MRLATFIPRGEDQPRAGAVSGDAVVAYEDGSTVAQLVASAVPPEATGRSFPLSDVVLLAPYHPRVVFAVGLNYAKHVAEGGAEVPDSPQVFMTGPASVTAPGGPVVRPPTIAKLDYEGELALLIGHDGGVGGYAIADDVSARDIREWQLTRHKGGDTFCPWGPWVTTADEVPDPYALRLRTWVDDELRQDASTSEMIFREHELIACISRTIALRPGDMIITGTPAGVAIGFDPPRFLQPGQRVRIEIEGLGSIEHEIVAG